MRKINIAFTIAISLVWFINGLFCKLLNFVPRHQMIVSRILGDEYSLIATRLIGILEVVMFFWILSGIRPRLCAIIQIIVVAAMNIIEIIYAADLLLFGKVNGIIALIFILAIAYKSFIMDITSTAMPRRRLH